MKLIYAVPALLLVPLFSAHGQLVINEIHHSPDVKTEPVEFIELVNTNSEPVDLTGWSFAGGIEHTFTNGPTVQTGGFLVIGQDPGALLAKFGVNAAGPWTGKLDGNGESIELRNPAGVPVDRVSYGMGFPWPTVGDAPGLSIELVNQGFDNELAGNWRASDPSLSEPGGQPVSIFPITKLWKYEQSGTDLGTAWKELAYTDGAWTQGPALLYVEDSGSVSPRNTPLTLGRITYYFRTRFNFSGDPADAALQFTTQIDDGAVFYLNGQEIHRLGMNNGTITNGTFASRTVGDATIEGPFTIPVSNLIDGENVIAVEVHQSGTGSSDIVFGMALSVIENYTPGTGGPSPGRRNNVFAANLPPQIRQVDHSPNQPKSGEPVRITAKITDPEGVSAVALNYQVVDPGNYIELADAAYQANWVSVAMTDGGTGADTTDGDNVFSVELPGTLQTHRRLIRYRITATDGGNRTLSVPYADDPQPNFAYFVYDGAPAHTAALQPGTTAALTISSNEMNRLPVYQLITKRSTVEDATWFSKYGGSDYPWQGTLAYDGKVYDHIRFRPRGGVWRYAMGKNMWKFDLNRGHDFQFRDNWGNKIKTGWTKVNLGASIQQGDYQHRGEHGMFESVGMRLFNLAGVPGPHSAFVQLRIIDEAGVVDVGDQYRGDFWGVYLALEQEDGRFLDEHDLPDGNLYKMESGTGTLNNTGPFGPTDKSDLNFFQSQYNGDEYLNRDVAWWRTNLNLNAYYGYQTVVQGIHHYDIADGKNYFFYRNPETQLWQTVPWDLDLTWGDNMYRSGQQGGNEPFKLRVLDNFSFPGLHPELSTEFRNRVREIRDLLFNDDQGFALLDEYARLLQGTNAGPTLLDADRFQWDYNPIMVDGSIVNTGKAGHGRFYQQGTPTKDFAGMVQLMKNYLTYRATDPTFSLDVIANDPSITATPNISYSGPAGFPANQLQFQSSGFSGAGSFTAMEWRLGEITDANSPGYDPGKPHRYEIEADWESGPLAAFNSITDIPVGITRVGRTYRARVRFIDDQGRASHWSAAAQFVVGEPVSAGELVQSLRVTELMFNPAPGKFEYVELHNISTTTALDLAGVKFTQGIDFTFPPGTILPANSYLVVIPTADHPAFRTAYGLSGSVPLIGPFAGNLANDGETLTLRTAVGGSDIVSFTYGDGRGWPVAADGAGHSLVFADSAEVLLRQSNGAGNYPGNWRASAFIGGSPGKSDPTASQSLRINEIAAHTDYNDPLKPEYDSNDWIELMNTQSATLILSGNWYLSDDPSNLAKWNIPSSANGFLPLGTRSYDEVDDFHSPITSGFGLNKAGEQIFLSHLPGNNSDRVVDAVSFKGQENGWSLGREPGGAERWFALDNPTRSSANAVAPVQPLISEIMFHPPDAAGGGDNSLDEFVELHNPTGSPIALESLDGGWRLNGDIGFTFPGGTLLLAGERVLVVNFNPAVTVRSNAFVNAYNLGPASPRMFGPYSGKLGNSSDRIALERPQAPDAPDAPGDSLSWVIVDEVIYADNLPWPARAADGFGASLHRLAVLSHGSDPANWTSAAPGPGLAFAPGTTPSITGQPADISVNGGANAIFSASATGSAPLRYQWLHNDDPIADETGASLQLPDVQPGAEGRYSVLVFNNFGSVFSREAALSLTVLPTILAHPQSRTVNGGAPVMFSVSAEGFGTLSYQWWFNGGPIPGATGSSLAIASAGLQHVGNYSVLVTHDYGSRTSSVASLQVLVAPSIVQQPHGPTVYSGENVLLSVVATGTQSLGYRWERNGSFLTTTPSGTLALNNVQPVDAGNYRVTVTNGIGADAVSQVAALTVLDGTDSDDDQLPDVWELSFTNSLTVLSDSSDNDDDQMTGLQEFISGTDPLDATSYLHVRQLDEYLAVDGTTLLSFEAAPGKSYTIEYRNDFENSAWTRLTDLSTSDATELKNIIDPSAASSPNRFYRLVTPRQ